jgi:hypothetical protein
VGAQLGHRALVWNVALSTVGTARDSVLSGQIRSVTDWSRKSADEFVTCSLNQTIKVRCVRVHLSWAAVTVRAEPAPS